VVDKYNQLAYLLERMRGGEPKIGTMAPGLQVLRILLLFHVQGSPEGAWYRQRNPQRFRSGGCPRLSEERI
jgi:hypothetical protein